MKYIIHVCSSQELVDFLDRYRKDNEHMVTGIPGLTHCTLAVIRSDEKCEEDLVKSLEGIVRAPFEISVSGKLDLFDENSLVARVNPSTPLLQLHNRVIAKAKPFISWEETPPLSERYHNDEDRSIIYSMYGSPYVAEFYNPHITIAEVNPSKVTSLDNIPVYSWSCVEFFVSRKTSAWQTVKSFPLRE